MRLLKKFENYMSREEMCNYLCDRGYSMNELEMCSDIELEEMCGMSMNQISYGRAHNENMDMMSREEMCNYLCDVCGYDMNELEVCSNDELHDMCRMNMFRGLKEHQQTQNYMFFSNLETIKRLVDEMLEMDEQSLDHMLSEHDWASDHISVAAENIEHVFNFVVNHDDPHGSEEHEIQVDSGQDEMSDDEMPDDEVYDETTDNDEVSQEEETFAQRESLRSWRKFTRK
jgi:hypothetical protein